MREAVPEDVGCGCGCAQWYCNTTPLVPLHSLAPRTRTWPSLRCPWASVSCVVWMCGAPDGRKRRTVCSIRPTNLSSVGGHLRAAAQHTHWRGYGIYASMRLGPYCKATYSSRTARRQVSYDLLTLLASLSTMVLAGDRDTVVGCSSLHAAVLLKVPHTHVRPL